MIWIVIGMFIGTIVVDEILFSAIESEDPDMYSRLGKPNMSVLCWNPVVIFKVIRLLVLPSTFDSGSFLQRKLWVSRFWNLGLIASIALAV